MYAREGRRAFQLVSFFQEKRLEASSLEKENIAEEGWTEGTSAMVSDCCGKSPIEEKSPSSNLQERLDTADKADVFSDHQNIFALIFGDLDGIEVVVLW